MSDIDQRECGTCSLCCTVLRVDELGKLAGEPCPKLAADGGCGIHSRRPNVCREYRCHWLRGGFENDDRPNSLGALVDFAPSAVGLHLAIVEAEPGAYESHPRLQALAENIRDQMPVRITDTCDVLDPDRPVRVLEAAGLECVIDAGRVRTYENGELLSDLPVPPIERIVRRIQQRIAALRWTLMAGRRRRRLERMT